MVCLHPGPQACSERPVIVTADTVPGMPLDPVTAREISRAAAQARTWVEKRDALIVAAVEAGAGPREVARAAGMNHASVIYMVKRAGRQADD